MGVTCTLPALPYFISYSDHPSQLLPDIPIFHDMKLFQRDDTYPIEQEADANLEILIDRAYGLGSTYSGYTMEGSISSGYAQDFLRFIQGDNPNLAGKQVLEIGCGTGLLMKLLAQLGADCIGVDPQPIQRDLGDAQNIEFIKDFFPTNQIKASKQFDLIILYAVLEHVSRPEELLHSLKNFLTPTGSVLVCVPDCEQYLLQGDPSVLFFQHFNYFTQLTLKNTMLRAGLFPIVTKGQYGDTIYAVAKNTATAPSVAIESSLGTLSNFYQMSEKFTQRISTLIQESLKIAPGLEVGIWVPARAVSSLALAHIPKVFSLRFFDDDRSLHSKFIPGFDCPLESFEDFLSNPPDLVLIFSKAFGEIIKRRLAEKFKGPIYEWDDLIPETIEKPSDAYEQ
jgi:2-polyprenyl-3-methyl-5-hydroxy-6-metoxy-1,4-benzoquinol methylase